MNRAALVLVLLCSCGGAAFTVGADPAVDGAPSSDTLATSETAPPGSDGAALPDPHPDDGGAVFEAAADALELPDRLDEASHAAAADASADVVDDRLATPADAPADVIDEPHPVHCSGPSSCPPCPTPGAYACCASSGLCGCTFTPGTPGLCG